jgi:hypothetical protein
VTKIKWVLRKENFSDFDMGSHIYGIHHIRHLLPNKSGMKQFDNWQAILPKLNFVFYATDIIYIFNVEEAAEDTEKEG